MEAPHLQLRGWGGPPARGQAGHRPAAVDDSWSGLKTGCLLRGVFKDSDEPAVNWQALWQEAEQAQGLGWP